MAVYYDNTRISAYKSCPRKFLFRHILHHVRSGTAVALIFGLSWHEAMDVVWGGAHSSVSDRDLVNAAFLQFMDKWEEEGCPSLDEFKDNPAVTERFGFRTPYTGLEMLSEYVRIRRPWIQQREVLAIEQPFVVPMPDVESRYYIGRIDKLIKEINGDIIPIEHKTTSSYATKTGIRASYVDGWSPNSQVDGYLNAMRMMYGRKVKSLYVDAALVHKTVHDVFKFIPIDHHREAITAFVNEANTWITRIEEEKSHYVEAMALARDSEGSVREVGEEQLTSIFPKNTESCSDYGGCSYRDVCRFVPRPHLLTEPHPGYEVKKWEPFDVLGMSKLGLEPEEV